jgi:hypothetical protein
MMTLQQFARGITSVPATTSWYLADLGESRGKQELFTAQSPQVLRVLREHALIESAVSSNRIEGVDIEQARVGRALSRMRTRFPPYRGTHQDTGHDRQTDTQCPAFRIGRIR